ncbi:MAG: nucleoside triphosphate pyrophosphohydrolase [Acidimicrobiia bacterium]
MTITVVGLGPGTLERMTLGARRLLDDPDTTVVLRTIHHPAAAELAAFRPDVVACDDLYEAHGDHADVYAAIAERVVGLVDGGPVVYAVPGSPLVGERAVGLLRRAAEAAGRRIDVLPAESFLDAVLAEVAVDPLADGLQVLDAQDLPVDLVLAAPTVVGHLTLPHLVVDVRDRLVELLGDDAEVTLLADLATPDRLVRRMPVAALDETMAGLRVSLFIPPQSAGLLGAVETMRRLRVECPWDAEQTHRSILPNLVEETFEAHDALAAIGADVPGGDEPDWGAYADAEEEVGDVLLQVLFHAVMAEETGGFSVESVATQLRDKLVRRHPHVFGDVEAGTAADTLARWEAIKDTERGRESLMDGVAPSMPGISRSHKLGERAARVGFDWPDAVAVLETLRGELDELEADLDDADRAAHEWGDVAFTLVMAARHLGLDPELALREAAARFETRFRAMEARAGGSLDGRSLEEMDALWGAVKEA